MMDGWLRMSTLSKHVNSNWLQIVVSFCRLVLCVDNPPLNIVSTYKKKKKKIIIIIILILIIIIIIIIIMFKNNANNIE